MFRPALRLSRTIAPRAPSTLTACTCLPLRPSLVPGPTPHLLTLTRHYAAKKSKASKKGGKAAAVEEDDDEVVTEVIQTEGKGKGKKGKGKGFVGDEEVPVGDETAYDLKVLEGEMDAVIDKLRVSLKTVVGRVGKVSPDLLDGVKVVDEDGKRRPLNEFATVHVKDGKDLLVTAYEDSFLKLVSKAIYDSPLNLTPQETGSTTLRVPIPKPDWEKRQALVKQASEQSEHARVGVRGVRGKGVKEIKEVFGKDDGKSETKKLDDSTKKRTAEIDTVFAKAKKMLMDE